MIKLIRLQKLIADRGYASRRKAEELIIAGKVYVDGKKITELGSKFKQDVDIVIDGHHLENKIKLEYYLLNKPRGYLSSCSDNKDRKIITDLIETNTRIFPVGRLDYDTTGLIILTNDGKLANILMHPSNKVDKEYLAKIEGNLTSEELQKLKRGIKVNNRVVRPLRVKVKERDKKNNCDYVLIAIEEGRNHIVKNIFKELNHEVIKLTRIRYGFLEIGSLKSGDYRLLSNNEVRKLYAYKKA